MKKILFLSLLTLFVQAALDAMQAKPKFKASQYLIAVKSDGATGTVSPGNSEYHLAYFDKTIEQVGDSDFWVIKDEGNERYSFKNAATQKYIRFDSSSDDRHGLVFADELAADNSTLFTLEAKPEGDLCYYVIHSAVNTAKVWNKRNTAYDGIYPIGVYSGSGGTNECFVFYDLEGNTVQDEQTVVDPLPGVGKTLGSFQSYADSLKFDGKTPTVDTNKKEFYITIPETKVGTSLTMNVRVQLKNAAHTLYIKNQTVSNGADFNFGTVNANSAVPIEIRNGSAVVASGTIYFTCLPLVQIYKSSSITTTYGLGRLSVTEADKPDSAEVLLMNIKVRGATAASKPKKPFAIKLKDSNGTTSIDRSFFGLRDDNNWILDAAYIDGSRMRNRVTTDLWNAYSAKPYHYAKEPALVNGTRGVFVEVFINDAYQGLYCMTEKVDRKQLKLKKLKYSSDSTTVQQRGGLYKGTSWASGTFLGNQIWDGSPHNMSTAYNNNSETWSGFEVKYPDYGDGEPVEWKPLVDAVTVSSYLTNDATFQSQVNTYFDMPVFLDYYLLLDVMLASDNQGKNAYFSVYDQSSSPMITITPWDCDGVWGIRWDGSKNITTPSRDLDAFLAQYEHAQNNLYLRLKSLDYNDFNQKLSDRYEQLRYDYFSYDSIYGRFERYYQQFMLSGAGKREENKWSVNLSNELNYLSSWIESRLAYLDNQYLGGPYVPPPPVSLSAGATPQPIIITGNPVRETLSVAHLTAGETLQIFNLQGRKLGQYNASANRIDIDVRHLPAGMYLLKTTHGVVKFIK